MQSLEVNGRSYPVNVIQALKRTSSVRIRDGRVVLKLSRYLRGNERERAVEKFLQWAEKRLSKISTKSFIEPVYEDGGRVVTHNKIYEIAIFEDERRNIKTVLRDGFSLEIYFPSREFDQEKVEKLVKREIMKNQLDYLREVLSELNLMHFGFEYKECRFRDVKSRFGSCSNRGVITIAYKLLFAPREVFRYVCVHELAHLKEFNHSGKFWALVAQAMPDYKTQEAWLRNQGFILG